MIIKVEDLVKGRTKSTRTDKWLDESHDVDVDKANEIEITVYDKPGDHPLPIGMLWVRISDIAEEMRRKKIEQDISSSGWVSADHVDPQSGGNYPFSPGGVGAPPGAAPGGPAMYQGGHPPPSVVDPNQAPVIDAWFALEPVGQIRLALSFSMSCLSITNSVTDNMQPNSMRTRGPWTLVWGDRVLSASAKKRYTRCMDTNSFSNSFIR